MKNLKKFVAVCGLILSGTAVAALDPLVYVVEASLDMVKLPAHEADRIEIRRCQGCQPEALKVSAGTRYRLAGFTSEEVTLQEFKRAIRNMNNRSDLLFYISYEVDSNSVTEFVLSGDE